MRSLWSFCVNVPKIERVREAVRNLTTLKLSLASMYHFSKCGFTSCKTGSKNKKTKKPQSDTLEGINYKKNYWNAWLIKGCAEYLKRNLAFLDDYKEVNLAFRGLKLWRTWSIRLIFYNLLGGSNFKEFLDWVFLC